MKKLLYAVLAVVILLGLSTPAKAQMIPHFNTLHNWSATVDSNNDVTIYVQVILDGYGSLPNGFPVPPGAFHQPSVRQSWNTPSNITATDGGWVTGAKGCVTCEMYAESDGTAIVYDIGDPPDLGYLIKEDDSGGIYCSIAGTDFFSFNDYLQWEIAYTRSKNTGQNLGPTTCPGPGGGACTKWAITNYCSAATTPPDYSLVYTVAPATTSYLNVYYVDSVAPCVSISGTGVWICSPVGISVGWPISLGLFPGNCTHNP